MNQLSKYDTAKHALAVAVEFDEVKDIRDKNVALAEYARQAGDKALLRHATGIKVRAERKAGQMLAEMQKAKGGRPELTSDTALPVKGQPFTLAQIGIEKHQSSRWQKLAAVPETEFEQAMEAALEIAGEVTTEVIIAVKKERRAYEIQQQRDDIKQGVTLLPAGVFEVVAIDPPWNYGREYDPDGSRVANPYPEMTQEQLLELEPPFADDCVLFLWTTHQFIWDAKALIDKWGFAYKAALVWDKERIGMGHWVRMQCEFCLVAVKGKPMWDNTTWRDIIREPRREHSRKPDAFYTMVEAVTIGRRLEYFSREQRQGWDVFGNDTTKF